MTPISPLRMWIAGGLVVASALYLVVSSLSAAGMSELPIRAVREQGMVSRVKLNGVVEPASTRYDEQRMELRFTMTDEQGERLEVLFAGIKPNAFRDGGQVMVEGYYDAGSDLLRAETLMAKCPSKYENQGSDHPGESAATKGT
jgi:cytochrome c-type biogenesis protein CcmE